MGRNYKNALLILSCCLVAVLICTTASAATTEVRIVKYGPDKSTILNETTKTFGWMEQNLPVYGDGQTHYYHQGPVFLDDPDPEREQQLRWNAAEDTNIREKDMGAVRGTSLSDICDLVGGMQPGDTVTLKAEDGFSKTFAYRNVYTPLPRQGQMVVAWYHADEGYVPSYRQGMRLVFFADNSTNPWGIHAFGNYDWYESAAPQYWYFYQQGQPPEKYPTTTGLSIQYISEIRIQSMTASGAESTTLPTASAVTPARQSDLAIPVVIMGAGIAAATVIMARRRD